MSTALALPSSGDANTWTPQEVAIAEAAGLIQKRGNQLVPVPRPIAEAFLHHCRRTGLDPIARQIYLIERGGKHNIQVSIDGARLVAERSGKYAGQTPVQWTDGTRAPQPIVEDGRLVRDGQGNLVMLEDFVWLEVWPQDRGNPMAARVGVRRSDFAEPTYAVATFDAYNAGGPMWRKMPALMLGKCAEMLALRKAFPQDLSGLYSTEEMEQAGPGEIKGGGASQAPRGGTGPQAAPQAQPELIHNEEASTKWAAAAVAAKSKAELKALYDDAKEKGALLLAVPHPAPAAGLPSHIALGMYITGLAARLPKDETPEANQQTGEIIDAEIVHEDDGPDDDLFAQAQSKLKSDAKA